MTYLHIIWDLDRQESPCTARIGQVIVHRQGEFTTNGDCFLHILQSSITLMCEQDNLNPLGLLGPEGDDIEQEEQSPLGQGDGGGRRRRSVTGTKKRRRRRAIPRKITKRQMETEQPAVERTLVR